MHKVSNILLVEDDSLDILIIERTLKKININHRLYIAHNGQEALNMLKGIGVDKITPLPQIIMLDINMPKMNGLELLSEIRKDAELRDIKVFIMTTSDHETDRITSQQLGISGYIIKPLQFNSSSSPDGMNLIIDLLNLKK